jgi:uncharacterized protein (DUF983 family)
VPAESLLARAARIAGRAVRLRCPRCGATPLFPGAPPEPVPGARNPGLLRRLRGWFVMEPQCLLCGLRYERAQGYFVGAIYINYAVSTTIAIGGYFLLRNWADLSTAAQFAIWVPFLLVFPLWFFRWSRSLWLGLMYFVSPES